MEKTNQTKKKPDQISQAPKKVTVNKLAENMKGMFPTGEEEVTAPAPAPAPKREIFKTPPAKQTGKLTRKADSNAPASDKRTFIIEDDLMEKIYLIKYWSRCDTLSEIINDALRLKIEKYESEHGILYPPQQ